MDLFTPIRIGALTARSRVVMPPHSSAIGNLWGTEAEAGQAIAYLAERARAGIAWSTIPGRISNVLAPGFEPSGISAVVHGSFRGANYVERVRRYSAAMHEAGALAATQLTMNGGYPHAPSDRFATPVNFLAPHAITVDELALLLDEYEFSAGTARQAGIDVLELHMNHEDLTQQFLSPSTNDRTDHYGGSLGNRMRLPIEVLERARAAFGRDGALGVRMNLAVPGSYELDEGVEIARRIEATGLVDYFHMVYGSTWGHPSYIQPHFYEPGTWSGLARRYREALSVPVVYTGLVNSPRLAAEIVARGDADLVGMARAHVADPQLLVKARAGEHRSIRPCVGGNDCINRRYVDGLPFGCAVNPHAAREVDGPWPGGARVDRPVLVVGGGPAGMELAALAAEAGAAVTLVERADALGGQLRTAALAPSFGRLGEYLDWQERRLGSLGVQVRLGTAFGAADLAAADAEVGAGAALVVATGARERVPDLPGVHLPHVVGGRAALRGAPVGRRVAVVVQDDHLAPLAVAEALADRGCEVTLLYSTHVPAQLLGRYIVGSVLGRLDSLGVQVRIMEEVVAIGDGVVHVRHTYSGRAHELTGFDTVVLACGGTSEAGLYALAREQGRADVHVLGDAYAPRRLVFATRQALVVARLLAGLDP
ncbi:FAD-dependent oxidoreductase [Dactylosporangium sp. NPDC050588]|uniref:oxidoreductase n=1 Tax=Dactylosporangium sp. NPDC050588 TaxID=3157211 RepID=UPI00340E1F4C